MLVQSSISRILSSKWTIVRVSFNHNSRESIFVAVNLIVTVGGLVLCQYSLENCAGINISNYFENTDFNVEFNCMERHCSSNI
jgi:hypothetical protein